MTIDLDTLYRNARELTTDLYPRLRALIPETTNQTAESQLHKNRGVTKFQIPWNSPAATLYFDIHAAARQHESALTLKLWGKANFRPGTDDVTHAVISNLPVLVDHALAAGHHDTDVTDTARLLLDWPTRIRALLDEALPDEQPWTKAPGNLRCPHCDRRLMLAPGWTHNPDQADVICRHCRDDAGQHYRWAPDTWVAVLQHQDAG